MVIRIALIALTAAGLLVIDLAWGVYAIEMACGPADTLSALHCAAALGEATQ